jgi:hypothetical protein
MPELTPMMSPLETPQTGKNLSAAVQDLEDIKGRMATLLRLLDLNTLIQIRHSLRPQGNEHYWYQITTITVGTFTIASLLCYALRFQLCRWLCKISLKDSNQVPQASPRNTTLELATPDQNEEQPSEDVTFTNYALRSAPWMILLWEIATVNVQLELNGRHVKADASPDKTLRVSKMPPQREVQDSKSDCACVVQCLQEIRLCKEWKTRNPDPITTTLYSFKACK